MRHSCSRRILKYFLKYVIEKEIILPTLNINLRVIFVFPSQILVGFLCGGLVSQFMDYSNSNLMKS